MQWSKHIIHLIYCSKNNNNTKLYSYSLYVIMIRTRICNCLVHWYETEQG